MNLPLRTSDATSPGGGAGGGVDPYAARTARIQQAIFNHFPRDSTPNVSLLEKAFEDAEFHHRGQQRKSGEPYILHPLRVALSVADAGLDLRAVILALLHDVIEDTAMTKDVVQAGYGDWLADMVDGLTKAAKDAPVRGNGSAAIETWRKLFSSTVRDLRTLQVKIFDRLDNMRDLDPLDRTRQRRIANETMTVYVPLAERLGLQDIADEYRTLCFRHLYPRRFGATLTALKARIKEEEGKATSIQHLLEEVLAPMPEVTVQPRYAKVSDQIHAEASLTRALDGYALTVPSMEDCYRAMGLLHIKFRVEPNSIKDYISNPRPNRYQGLHSRVFIGGEPTAIRIWSREMDAVNRRGILKGWHGSQEELGRYYESYLKLLEHFQETDDLRMEDVLRHAQMDTLQMFTPKGALLTFPQGANVLDFAYAIHSDLGNHCQGAEMGGQPVSPLTELRDGEVVKILTDPDVVPNAEWEANVRTNRAKIAIRRWLKDRESQRAQEVGRQILIAGLERVGKTLTDVVEDPSFEAALAESGLKQAQFYQQVGRGKTAPWSFFENLKLIDGKEAEILCSGATSLLNRVLRRRPAPVRPVVRIRESDDGFIRMARDCGPLPGDEVVGVQEAESIAVHRLGCPSLEGLDPDRRVQVAWEERRSTSAYRLGIQLAEDRPGLVYKVSKVMRDLKVNIEAFTVARGPGRAAPDFEVSLSPIPFDLYQKVIVRLRTIKEIERISHIPVRTDHRKRPTP